MASIFSNPTHQAKLPLYDHNLSQPIDFSSIPGVLTPLFCQYMAPGEKISGYADMITRTNEFQTAAFARINQTIEYFFVPASKLNQVFNEWFFNIDDRPTTLRPSMLPERAQTLPNVSPKKVRTLLMGLTADSQDFESPVSQAIRLLFHYRYPVYQLFDSSFDDVWSLPDAQNYLLLNMWNIPLVPFQVYQACYYDYYRNSLWENNDVEAYNTDDWMTSLSGETITAERLHKIMRLHLRNQDSDYFTAVKPSPLQMAIGMLNINGVRENALLAVNDWLSGTGFSFSFGKSSNYNANVSVGSLINDPSGTPMSFRGNGGVIGSVDEPYVLSDGDPVVWSGESVPAQPSPIDAEFSHSGTEYKPLDANHNALNYSSGDNIGVLSSSDVKSLSYSSGSLGITSNWSTILANLRSQINTQAIRVMFALEKLAKITSLAGKHYDDQVLAHYGFKVPKSWSNEVQLIGQQRSQIAIQEVVSNVTVPDGSQAGEIFGKGYGVMNDKKAFDFTAPVHGYFIAIYSAAPERTYTPSGNPKEYAQFRREDFPQPELMNLGQQPLFYSEWDLIGLPYNPVTGWQWRYMEMKSRVPMSIGAFARVSYDPGSTENGILADWSVQYPLYNRNLFSRDPGDTNPLSFMSLKVVPSSLNSLFLLQWQPDSANVDDNLKPLRLFDRDPLFHHLEMNVYYKSYMSTYGEPRLD